MKKYFLCDWTLSKLFWLFAYTFSISCFGFYVYTAYYKLNHEPEIIKSTREVRSWNFPRPAVTICPNIFAANDSANIVRTRADYHIKKPMNKSQEECFTLMANLHWCNRNYFSYAEFYCKQYKYDDIDVIEYMRKTAFKMNDKYCSAHKSTVTDDVLTFQGICFSQNMMDLRMIYTDEVHEQLIKTSRNVSNPTEPNWTPERKFIAVKNSTQLLRVLSGQNIRFVLPLNSVDDRNFCYRPQYKLYIHKPNEILTWFHAPIHIYHDDAIWITVTVKSLRTDPALRSFPIDVRKCYFEGERKLKFFKTYTKALCEWECSANASLKFCGCVMFQYPRNQTTKVCNVTSLKECTIWTQKCNCYAPCNDVEYTYTTDSYLQPKGAFSDWFPNASSVADIYVQMKGLMQNIEEVENLLSYKIPSFIADFGGFLGLFLGCSLLSILETFHIIFTKIKSSRKVKPEVSEQNDKETDMQEKTVTRNEMNQLRSELNDQRKEDKERIEGKFAEILMKLDAVTQKKQASISSSKTNDDQLINDAYHEVKELN